MPTRTAFTEAEKLALRQQHAQQPLLTQKELCTWFMSQYNKPIRQATVSEILSKRYSHFDTNTVRPARKKQRGIHYTDLEAALAQWVVQNQQRVTINGDILRTRARWYWQRLPQYQGLPEPPFSNGWLAGFKERYNIKDRRRHGESAEVDDTQMMADIAILQTRLARYSPEDQYNCDETGLFWKMIPDRSLSTVPIPGNKKEKVRITIHHCVNATGSHKLQPWIVGRYQRPRCFAAAGINIDRLDCTYRANKNSWMTGPIMLEWLQWFDSQMSGRKVVLLMDNFSAHQTAANNLSTLPTEYGLRNTEIVWLPPNTTSKSQPLDQGIIATFKACYRRYWVRYMMEEAEEARDPLHTMNLLKAIRFVIRAWHEVSPQTILNCWNHSAIAIQAQPSIQQQSQLPAQAAEALALLEQQLQTLQQQQVIRQRMTIQQLIHPLDEEVVDDLEDSAEHIALLFEPTPPEESDEEVVEELPRISASQALQLLKQLRLHEEQSDNCNNSWLQSLDKYEKVVQQRMAVGLQQQQISSFFHV